jgi:hypothetical protein
VSAYTDVEHLMDALDLRTADTDTKRRLGELIVRVSGEFDRILLFDFDGDTQSRVLDGTGGPQLWLPPPGAGDVQSVVENGVVVGPEEYEIERVFGRSLTRLTSSGALSSWTDRSRGITVTYTPNLPPPDLEEYCIRECVRSWQGKAAGYPDVVGVAGSNERTYTRAFAPGTMEGLRAIARTYGVRNVIAI